MRFLLSETPTFHLVYPRCNEKWNKMFHFVGEEAAVGRSAIVVGAGIGGLAVTRGLVESGWRVRVYEQAVAFGAVGAGLAIEPNAVRALDWLGLGQQLRASGMRQGPAGLRTRGDGGWCAPGWKHSRSGSGLQPSRCTAPTSTRSRPRTLPGTRR